MLGVESFREADACVVCEVDRGLLRGDDVFEVRRGLNTWVGILELDIVDCARDDGPVLDLVCPDEFLRRPDGAGLAVFVGPCEFKREASAGDSRELISIISAPANVPRFRRHPARTTMATLSL